MSHVTTIKCHEKYDLPSLRQMCQDMGWQWMEGQRTYRWYGQFMGDYPLPTGFTQSELGHCEHAIRIPGANYEIGVIQKDGEWKLLWDFYSSGGLQGKLGQEAGLLKQAYNQARTTVVARQNRKRFYRRPAPTHMKGWKKMVVEV